MTQDMDDSLCIVRAAIERLLSATTLGDSWSITVPTLHTCFRNGHIVVASFELSGKAPWKDPHAAISVRFLYKIGHETTRLRRASWTCKGMNEAIRSLLNFSSEKDLCHECGKIKDRGAACDICEFFRAFSRVNQLDQECAICVEKVFRTMLACGHSFHLSCISRLPEPDEGNVCCPICRKELTAEEMTEFFGDFIVEEEED